jgi:hypothetical protein
MSRVPTSAKRVNVPNEVANRIRRSVPRGNGPTSAGQVSYNPMEASRNDIVYCGDVVVKAAKRIASRSWGAQFGPMKSYAMGINSVTDTMSPFIVSVFNVLQQGFLKRGQDISEEEIKCMQATMWYEQELAEQGSNENIPFLKSNIIYQDNSNGNGNGNGNGANGDEKDFPFVALGLGGLAVLGLGLWYISSREEDEDFMISRSAQRFQHPVFN